MTVSQAKAANKSRGTVSMLTFNMWREDYSSSLVLESKLVMQHLLNINGLNYVVILLTNQYLTMVIFLDGFLFSYRIATENT